MEGKQSWAAVTAKQIPSNAAAGNQTPAPQNAPRVDQINQNGNTEKDVGVKFDQKLLSKVSSARLDAPVQFGFGEEEKPAVPVPSNPPIPQPGFPVVRPAGPVPVVPPGPSQGAVRPNQNRNKGVQMPGMGGNVPWQYPNFDPAFAPYGAYGYPPQYMGAPGSFPVRPAAGIPRPMGMPATTTPAATVGSPNTPAFTLPAVTRKPIAIKIIDPTTGKPLDLASIKESTKKETEKPVEQEHAEKPTEEKHEKVVHHEKHADHEKHEKVDVKPADHAPADKHEVSDKPSASPALSVTSKEEAAITLPTRESKAIPIRRPDEKTESPEPKQEVVSEVTEANVDSRAETPADVGEDEEGYEFEIESEEEYLDDTVPDVDVEEEATEDFQDELAARLSSLHMTDSKPEQMLEVAVEVTSPTATYKARPPELKKLDTKQAGPADATPAKSYIKLTSFDNVQYPANVAKPSKTNGVFKYDKEFLMSFLTVEKWDYPAGLPSRESIFDDTPASARSPINTPSSARGKGGMMPRMGSMRSSSDLQSPTVRSGLTNAGKLSNEERFAAHMNKVRATGLIPSRNSALGQGGRTFSSDGLGPRTTSKGAARGKGRGAPKSRKELELEKQFTIPEDQIKPLEMSESAWVAQLRKQQEDKDLDEEAKHRLREDETRKKLQGLLNKLTLDKFERLSDQIIALDVSSPSQLKLVIYGVYDKAVDEPNFGPMYARLCAKMSTQLPTLHPWIVVEKDDKNNLFRRILLNKCQEEFERGSNWSEIGANRPAVDPSTLTAEERQALADEDDLRFRLKRRSLGNIKFIGELFKLGMLTEKIMHSCITNLLMNGVKVYIKNDKKEDEENRDGAEEELESLCKLMATVGQKLDHPKAAKIMDAYFGEMLKLSEIPSVPSRIRFALQDVVDLRDDKWQARSNIVPTGPKTIAEIRKEAEKAQEQAKMGPRQGSRGMGPPQFSGVGPRNQSGMGGRQDSRVKDNWSKDSKKGSSSNLAKGWSKESGRISPANGQRAASPGAMARTPSSSQPARAATPSASSNMFSALEAMKEDHGEPHAPVKLDREKAERRIENMIAEWFASQSYDEFSTTWKEFGGHEHDEEILDKFLTHALDVKDGDERIPKSGDVISQAKKDGLVSSDTILAALLRQSEVLEDLVSDIPKIFGIFGSITARILAGGAVESDKLLDIAQPLIDSPSKVPSAPKLLKAVFGELKKESAESAASTWKSAGLELAQFFPSTYDADKIAEWVSDADLKDVFA